MLPKRFASTGMRATRRTFVIVTLAFAGGLLLLWAALHLVSTGTIEVVEAEFGVPGRTCTAAAEVKKRISEACGGFRPRCLVSVSTGLCGDPAPGVVKTLTIEYMCGTTRKRASAAEFSGGLELSCP